MKWIEWMNTEKSVFIHSIQSAVYLSEGWSVFSQ